MLDTGPTDLTTVGGMAVTRIALAGLAMLVLSACVGATTRAEFEEEIRRRGGGLTTDFVTESLDVVAVEVGASSWTELDVLALNAKPGNRTLATNVRREDRRDFVDTISVANGEITNVTPVQDAGDLPLDDLEIPLDSVALDQIEQLSDEALAVFGQEDGFVDAIGVVRAGDDVTIRIDVESARETATVVFSADGTLRGIE